MLEIAGVAISLIGLAVDLSGKIGGWVKFEETDLLVDRDWLALAIDKSIVDGTEDDYRWSSEDKIASRELRGTHSVVMAVDEEKRTKYRMVRGREGERLVLMKRLTG